MSSATDADSLIPRLPVDEEQHRFHDWDIDYQKSHILHSMCANEKRCRPGEPGCCELCRYEAELPALTHLPEMVFPKNRLRLRHRTTGAQLEFNALDALRAIRPGQSGTLQQVACAAEWQETRPHADADGKPTDTIKVKPYDWTYSTDYRGTVSDAFRPQPDDSLQLNIRKLMAQERILFYHELTLYEDELHDHGIAECTAKIRVMPSGFFVLLRFFLRIDGVLVRIHDTRYHYEIENDYILQEYTAKEAGNAQLKHVPASAFTVPHEIERHLPLLQRNVHKLYFSEAAV